MWIIGITGGLGSGKSTLSHILQNKGIPVQSADEDVHDILRSDKDVQQKIKALWPEVFVHGEIDRIALGHSVLKSPSSLKKLEDIIYPKLAIRFKKFIQKNLRLNKKMIVLDVPLLMEVGLDKYCHWVILVVAPHALRKRRVLSRSGMTHEKFETLTSHQMKDAERLTRADFVIRTGRDKASAVKEIMKITHLLAILPSPKWDGKWPTNFTKDQYGKGNRFRHRNNRF